MSTPDLWPLTAKPTFWLAVAALGFVGIALTYMRNVL